jgi:hypothetical protein
MAAIWSNKGNYFHTGKKEARYTCICEGKETRPLSNAPVGASTKTHPDMYLHKHTHTGCLQRHVYIGSFAEAS